MKAKELAKILLENPNAEVVHYQYIGCDTPILSINTITIEKRGVKTESSDGGHFIDKNGVTKADIVILKHKF